MVLFGETCGIMARMQLAQPAHPVAIVILGGTGDLATRKLFPALFDLSLAGGLPAEYVIIGASRKQLTSEAYQSFVYESIAAHRPDAAAEAVTAFCRGVRYVAGCFDEASTYEEVKAALRAYDQSIGACTNKLFYLAVPPQHYQQIFTHLHESDALALCDGVSSWARLLVEKPFGRDLATAQALERQLCALFADEQVYRIDHYLAKDAIENILAVRFANCVLADSWHGDAVESVRISLRESHTVGDRGIFYDGIGALRDVGQNHLLQMFALLTMPQAPLTDSAAVRAARADALASLARATPTDIVRGQYQGYRATDGVAETSDTETYFSFSFTVPDGVWRNTRFTFEAGKAMPHDVSEAVLTFRPRGECGCKSDAAQHEHRNVLRMQFAPRQHISLSVWTKAPGFQFRLQEEALTLVAAEGEQPASPEAYERVLYDCITGDQTRFVSSREVEHAWRFITPILERLASTPLDIYEPGTVPHYQS